MISDPTGKKASPTGFENTVRSDGRVRNAALAYWSEGQVANRLGVSVQWLRKERARGTSIRFRRFGRSVKYKISEVLEYEDRAVVQFTGQDGKSKTGDSP